MNNPYVPRENSARKKFALWRKKQRLSEEPVVRSKNVCPAIAGMADAPEYIPPPEGDMRAQNEIRRTLARVIGEKDPFCSESHRRNLGLDFPGENESKKKVRLYP